MQTPISQIDAGQFQGGSLGTGLLQTAAIAGSVALSTLALRWFQQAGDPNALVSLLIHTLLVLIPAGVTYFFLSRAQEKRLSRVSATLVSLDLTLKDLRRVVEIEKNYYANERLIDVERRVIQETGSSMQEVAELVADLDDGSSLQIRLKDRFRLHVKSLFTLTQAFAFEVEQNYKKAGEIENEFSILSKDQREERVHATGKQRAERMAERYNFKPIMEGLAVRLTQKSDEIKKLATAKRDQMLTQLDAVDKGAEDANR
jgi:hypothetical protein